MSSNSPFHSEPRKYFALYSHCSMKRSATSPVSTGMFVTGIDMFFVFKCLYFNRKDTDYIHNTTYLSFFSVTDLTTNITWSEPNCPQASEPTYSNLLLYLHPNDIILRNPLHNILLKFTGHLSGATKTEHLATWIIPI